MLIVNNKNVLTKKNLKNASDNRMVFELEITKINNRIIRIMVKSTITYFSFV